MVGFPALNEFGLNRVKQDFSPREPRSTAQRSRKGLYRPPGNEASSSYCPNIPTAKGGRCVRGTGPLIPECKHIIGHPPLSTGGGAAGAGVV